METGGAERPDGEKVVERERLFDWIPPCVAPHFFVKLKVCLTTILPGAAKPVIKIMVVAGGMAEKFRDWDESSLGSAAVAY